MPLGRILNTYSAPIMETKYDTRFLFNVEKNKSALFFVIFTQSLINFSGLVYLAPALTLTIYYNVICYDLYKYKKNKFDLKKAKKVFSYSILYLFLIFVLFLIDNLI